MNAASPRATWGGRSWRRLVALGAAGLLLASCGTTAGVTLTGHPSISIDVPLSLVACTTGDSCLAVGTSAATSGPATTAEYLNAHGVWVALRTPVALQPTLVAASCWREACLIGGGSPAGEVLWRYRGSDHTATTLTPPPQGLNATAVSCYGAGACALIDSPGGLADSRLSVTLDGGDSWSTPADLAWSAGLTVTGLACVGALVCVAVASSGSAPASPRLELTRDGGITWMSSPLPTGARGLTSLSCAPRRCDALITVATGSDWATSGGPGTHWVLHRLAGTATSLACVAAQRCVLVGTLHSRAWVATTRATALTTLPVRYVPSPFTAVACGSTRCALAAPSTVASLSP